MKSLAIALVAMLALLGCATSTPIKGPSGNTAYLVKCGSARIDLCYEEAGKVCPNGYIFADRQENPNAIIAPMGAGYMMARGPNTMLIECKR